MAESPQTSPLFQALEKRFMFDASAASTAEKGFDLSHGVDPQEQQEVLAALATNPHAIATQSLYQVINYHQTVNENYASIKEVVFIDSAVQDPEEIIAGISRNAAVEIIQSGQNGLDEMAAALKNYTHLDAIHIISHGQAGELFLGNLSLSLQDMHQYSSELAAMGQALSPQGDILLYGCNVAEGSSGVQFIQAFNQMTGADVAASDQAVGGAALGGRWNLDYSSGNISTDTLIQNPAYDHLLDIGVSLTDRSYTAGSYAQSLNPFASFTGLTDNTINSLTVTINNFQTGDTLDIFSYNDLSTDQNHNIYIGSSFVGTYQMVNNVLIFNLDDVTAAEVTEIADHVSFRNALLRPVMDTRNITFTVGEDNGSSGSGDMELSFDPTLLTTRGSHLVFYSTSDFKPVFSDSLPLNDQTFLSFNLHIANADAPDQFQIDGSTFSIDQAVSGNITTTNNLTISAVQSGWKTWDITVAVPQAESSPSQFADIVNSIQFKPLVDSDANTRYIRIDSVTAKDANNLTNTQYLDLESKASIYYNNPIIANMLHYNTYVVTESPIDLNPYMTFYGLDVVSGTLNVVTSMSATIGNPQAGDVLGLDTADGMFTVDTNTHTIFEGAAIVGTYTVTSDSITFDLNHITSVMANQLVRHISFMNSSDTPVMDTRSITLTLGDQDNRVFSDTMQLHFQSSTLAASGTNPTFAPHDDFKALFSNVHTVGDSSFSSFYLRLYSLSSSDQMEIDGTTFTLSQLLQHPIQTVHGLELTGTLESNLYTLLEVDNNVTQPLDLASAVSSIYFKPDLSATVPLVSRIAILNFNSVDYNSYIYTSTSSSNSGVGVYLLDSQYVPGDPLDLAYVASFSGLNEGTINSLNVTINNPAPGDTLVIDTADGIFFTDYTHNIYYERDILVGSWSFANNTLTCTLNNVTNEMVTKLAEHVFFKNTLNSPLTTTRNFTFTVAEQDGRTGSATMNLFPAPVIAIGSNAYFIKGDGFKPVFSDFYVLDNAKTFASVDLLIINPNLADQFQIDGTTFTLSTALNGTISTVNGLDISVNEPLQGLFYLTIHLNAQSQAAQLQNIMSTMSFRPVQPLETQFTNRQVMLEYVHTTDAHTIALFYNSYLSVRITQPPLIKHSDYRNEDTANRFEFKNLELDTVNNDSSALSESHLEILWLDAYKHASSQAERDAIIHQLLAMLQSKAPVPGVANTLYEIAVDKTNKTNNTDFLTTVVKSITAAAQSKEGVDKFLSKVANDSRLTPDQELAVINSLVEQKEHATALALIKKFENNGRLDAHGAQAAQCSP